MPDCEWLINTVPSSFIANSDKAGTVGLGVGSVGAQSETICFQNSGSASSGNCMPGNTLGYSGPKRKIAHAASCPAENTGGNWSAGVLPSLALLIAEGFPAERPRQT